MEFFRQLDERNLKVLKDYKNKLEKLGIDISSVVVMLLKHLELQKMQGLF